ncbi:MULTISPECIES: ribose 5-phosphate isomerase A [Staphylococcus]|uniref:Ribose-5-phosphate isomerase A n=1 Tax=Staphylococcus pettenkoferi TaxID=170573 RepID=A0A1Z3U0T3_9STAP|nr:MULTISPECIES: ribose 5-phosphate isomerase A [Staphylococcus]ASE36770.1 ribose 5-phosphate isomerase A [Staphylococcus pettenkoferi]EHM70705.1 ribose 5-phosphate isomerase A [Staphylococcus pettenkoferi VCU012]MBX8993921.1 ribose 5-phosphate isomerase A [Staphylococcus pettenkoferi]MCI2791803.1 ribose 5-phosphate isomerase A [Staphylococcus pettenkoferi]MCY1564404.1 ribose 5-phosphate isomerase A [Staphylococcus pettenkoferi]
MDSKQLKLSTFDDALNHIHDNMVLGIGSGSTIELLVPKIADKVEREGLDLIGVCTSNKTAYIAKERGLKIVDVNDVDHVDVAIDGADEIDGHLNLIKGGGGALFREKVIDSMARKFIVVADESKTVDYLGQTFKLPVEVDKFNWLLIAKRIEKDKNVKAIRRMADDVPFITDNGNYILDLVLYDKINPYEMHEYLIHLIGVLETGYFLDTAEEAIVGTQDGVKIQYKDE